MHRPGRAPRRGSGGRGAVAPPAAPRPVLPSSARSTAHPRRGGAAMPVESQTPGHRASGAGPTDALPPAGLPLLGRGRHASPEDGACLMEYTSVLAGLRFSDRPRCTAPTLASVARLINDATSDDARPELARRAPELSVRRHLSCEQSAAVVAGVLSGV